LQSALFHKKLAEKFIVMKLYLLLLINLFSFFTINAQTITGTVSDSKGNTLPGANVYIKGSYDGAIANADGKFDFKTTLQGKQTLVVSCIGFQNNESEIDLKQGVTLSLNITLTGVNTQLNEVVITAGTFEAGDKKRSIQLQALDILTTANSNGDIYNALNTMPGAQMVGEEGALFVRGGEKEETKTFVDGMLVSNPYTSKVPDLPMRGRFSPSLFSGVMFSSGGYSAEYGQALSSALILQTQSFPEKSLTSFSIMPFGLGVTQSIKGDSATFTGSLNYSNMQPYFSTIKQNVNWQHSPENIDGTVTYRKKLGKTGMLRSFGSFNSNRLGLGLPNYLATDGNQNLKLKNTDAYVNTVYQGQL
jgi:vitamin B12 transporter